MPVSFGNGEKVILRITETAAFESLMQRNNSRKDSKTKSQTSFMFSSYKYAEKAHPNVFDCNF